MKLIFLGPPGAGKGTQAEIISKEYSITQLSTGDILRANTSSGTELGKLAQGFMCAGNLVPDEIIIGMIKEEISKPELKNGYLLDGFPRTVPQAEALDRFLESHNDKLDAVLVLEVSNDDLIHRLSARRTCPVCHRTYHLIYNPPLQPGKCNYDEGVLYQRDDDREEAILNRLKVYENQTQPLIEYYTSRSLARRINGFGYINDIFKQIKIILDGIK